MQAINSRKVLSFVGNLLVSLTGRRLLLAAFIATCPYAHDTQAQEIDFISVASDRDLRDADKALCDYLKKKVSGLRLNIPDPATYRAAIDLVRDPRRTKPYLARLTPYPLVAAKMLGAEFDELATYKSKATGTYTYSAYFAVRSDRLNSDQRLYNLLEGLPKVERSEVASANNATGPLTFEYHDQFSTSSFFLPSLYFRNKHAFTGGTLVTKQALDPTRPGGQASSSLLIADILDNRADLAAVWDGTKAEAQKKSEISARLRDVQFIKLPTTLPNDILVCDKNMNDVLEKKLQSAIAEMKPQEINKGDVDYWTNVDDPQASEVRAALEELYRSALAPPSAVTVKIDGPSAYIKAAREAIRLSGTELVEHDPDYHLHEADFRWTLTPIHDQAVRLESGINAISNIPIQSAEISYLDLSEDLTKRLGSFIHSKMHRIRYVWPYQSQKPVVIRDVDFSLRPGSSVWVQPINWIDPDHDQFTADTAFRVHVTACDFHTIELDSGDFQHNADLNFDPMSPRAFRVILERPSLGGFWYNVLAWTFASLFVAGGMAAAVAVWPRAKARRLSRLGELLTCPDVSNGQITSSSFATTCDELAQQVHDVWRNEPVAEANVIYCSRGDLESFVQELNVSGDAAELVGKRTKSWKRAVGAKIPFLRGFLGLEFGGGTSFEIVTDPEKQPDHVRIGKVIGFALKNQKFSSFVGQPLEWRALHCMVSHVFGLEPTANSILRDDSSAIEPLISQHFCTTIAESVSQESLFGSVWQTAKEGDHYTLRMSCQLPAKVTLDENGTGKPVQRLSILCQVPADKLDSTDVLNESPLKTWILGRVIRRTYINTDTIELQMRPLALLQE